MLHLLLLFIRENICENFLRCSVLLLNFDVILEVNSHCTIVFCFESDTKLKEMKNHNLQTKTEMMIECMQ